jgi:hypothetical protein
MLILIGWKNVEMTYVKLKKPKSANPDRQSRFEIYNANYCQKSETKKFIFTFSSLSK